MPTRRQWLWWLLGAGGGAAALVAVFRRSGCSEPRRDASGTGEGEHDVAAEPAGLPWVTLVAALGPWPLADRAAAEGLAQSMVRHERPAVPSGLDVADLAHRLHLQRRRGSGAIDVRSLTEAERALVDEVVRLIYGSPQVMAFVVDEPLPGECAGDTDRPQRTPGELGW